MTGPISVRIAELRVEADLADSDLAALEAGLEVALTELAQRLQILLSGRGVPPDVLVLPDLFVRDEAASHLLAGHDVDGLTDLILASVETRLRARHG